MNAPTDLEPSVALTSREREVLEQIFVRQPAKELAGDLPLAPRTVEQHMENLRTKLHAQNTDHLITRAS